MEQLNELFDIAWEYLYAAILKGALILDFLLSYLHFMGPVAVIFILAIATVALTKVLKNNIRTKRYGVLERDFQHWLEVREEALKCEDREKGKILAKNIDKAHLNRAYYDYFLEGLLLGLITFYLPVVSMATYINESYRAERLTEFFGKSYLFQFGKSEPVLIGGLFWFILAVLLINSSIIIFCWAKKRYWTCGTEKHQDIGERDTSSDMSPMKQSGSNQFA